MNTIARKERQQIKQHIHETVVGIDGILNAIKDISFLMYEAGKGRLEKESRKNIIIAMKSFGLKDQITGLKIGRKVFCNTKRGKDTENKM